MSDAPVIFRGDSTALASATSPGDVTDLLRYALEMGRDAETMERLVALHERITDRAAATEFMQSLAEFQNECPPIPRKRTAKIPTQSGGTFSYNYADLNDIVDVVRPLLYARGFSFAWDSEVRDRLMVCTCTLGHVNGHTKKASFASPVESKAGMSEQQKFSSALSYAKRVSLTEVLGITTADPPEEGGQEPISPAQVKALEAMAKETATDMQRFLKYMGVSAIDEIPQANFTMATQALRAKERKASK